MSLATAESEILTPANRSVSPFTTSKTIVFWAAVIVWITVLSTFSLPGRGQLAEGEIDLVAKIKIAARLFAIVVVGWFVFAECRKRHVQNLASKFWLWGLFVIWACLSTTWSPLKSITLGQAAGQLQLLILALAVGLCYRDGIPTILFHTLAALLVFSSIYGVGSFLMPESRMVVRASSQSLVHPTALAAAASLGLIIATCALVTAEQTKLRALAILAFPVFVIAMLVAHNRTSLVMTPVICALVVVAKGKSHLLAASAIVICILGTTYLVLDPGLIGIEYALGSSVDFLHRGQSTTQITALSGREEMWTKMWRSYLESPLIGHGYLVCSATGSLYVWYSELNHTAHNAFLQALVSTGLIGCVLFVLFNTHVLSMLGVSVIGSRPDPLVSTVALATAIWFIAWCLLNSSILGPVRPESVVYAVVVGMIIGRYQWCRTDNSNTSPSSVNLEGQR